MDYINNTTMVLNVPSSEIIVSQAALDLMSRTDSVIQGFRMCFTNEPFTGDLPTIDNIDTFRDDHWFSKWKNVTTTKTDLGVEIYVTDENLPTDYSDSNTRELTKIGNHKYTWMFIGFKDLVSNTDKTLMAIKMQVYNELPDEYVMIHGVNTSIVFRLNLNCNYFMNITDDLSYIKTLEDDFEYNKNKGYSIKDMKFKILSYRDLGETPSGDFYNGILKY